jgi:hypothetical protein
MASCGPEDTDPAGGYPEVNQGDGPVAGLWRLTLMHADVCALGRLVTRVCTMTSAAVARLIYQMLLARMSPGQ